MVSPICGAHELRCRSIYVVPVNLPGRLGDRMIVPSDDEAGAGVGQPRPVHVLARTQDDLFKAMIVAGLPLPPISLPVQGACRAHPSPRQDGLREMDGSRVTGA